MRVAVIGAGIVGVTSAHELAAAGHEVTVFEQTGSVAAEGSFANAGLYGTGWAAAWSPLTVTGSLLMLALRARLPGALRPSIRPGTCAWTLRWLAAHRLSAQQISRRRLHRLAGYSRARMLELTRLLQLDFERSSGSLIVSKSEAETEHMQLALATFGELGVRSNLLTPEQCRSIEPGLNPEARLHAGVHLPEDGVGNCREFAHLIRQQAQRHGTRFVFNAQVLAIHPGARPELTVAHKDMGSDARPVRDRFDAVLVCAAMDSGRLLSALGVRLTLIGVHGHSVTAPLRLDEVHAHIGPNAALIDPALGVTITRMGARVRVSGGARMEPKSRSVAAAALRQLYQSLDDWYPGAARVGQARHWQGVSPSLPDGLPVIGPSGADGVWLNLGHGGVGWALSCGSAQMVAAMMDGIPPEIDVAGLGAERLR